ncbi:MAG: hypothetical protein RIQ70_322 [Bacteroidota bacterium]
MKRIIIVMLAAFLISGIKAHPKDSVVYSFKAGVISPYCFKYKTYDEIATKYNTTYSSPFNSGFSIGLDASRKNFSFELSFDHSSFRRISQYKIYDSFTVLRDLPYKLTQVRLLPKFNIIHSANSSLKIGCGFTMARPSSAYSTNNPNQRYYLYLGDGICCNIEYTRKLPKRRLELFASLNYEKLDNDPALGRSPTKYDYSEDLDLPIYMASLGLKYRIGRK